MLTFPRTQYRRPSCLTWRIHVLGLRVAVGRVAGGGLVGVRGQLVVRLPGAVDENGQTLHLVTGRRRLTDPAEGNGDNELPGVRRHNTVTKRPDSSIRLKDFHV